MEGATRKLDYPLDAVTRTTEGGKLMEPKNQLADLIQDAVRGCARYWALLIARYLTEHGVAILPCKMGDEVWGIKSFNNGGKRVKKGIVYQMFYGEDMKLCIAVKGVCRGVWNEKVFATEEDARRALEEQI
jgi:hypothetical protein